MVSGIVEAVAGLGIVEAVEAVVVVVVDLETEGVVVDVVDLETAVAGHPAHEEALELEASQLSRAKRPLLINRSHFCSLLST